ncbi:MAG: UbiA family prenyltransferase [Patescibacteria group bacterium]
MTTHIQLVFWALQVLWGQKTIHCLNRLRLWKKSINLYLSLLAFTDKHRPADQLFRVMVSAVLTAVYDYDTDWEPGSDGSRFKELMCQYVKSETAETIAVKLLESEKTNALSEDGLERGSVAFKFYCLVIDSEWLKQYSPAQLDTFGKFLQILDDILDFNHDRAAGDKNCLLLSNRDEYITQAREFLKSDFFQKLKGHSRIYWLLELKVRWIFSGLEKNRATFRQLLQTTRPSTGVYALVLTIISFRFFTEFFWPAAIASGLAYLLLTMSIMAFNDFTDREIDAKKGKTFAKQHPAELKRFWWQLNTITTLWLLLVVGFDWATAGYCLLVWLIGLSYSKLRSCYLVNNLVVALCSASPALCGVVYYRHLSDSAIVTFFVFLALIFLNEIFKDVEDRRFDSGNKNTMPVKIGHMVTMAYLNCLLYIPATIIIFHPSWWVKTVTIPLLAVIAFQQALVFFEPKRIFGPKATMRLLLEFLLVILLLSP